MTGVSREADPSFGACSTRQGLFQAEPMEGEDNWAEVGADR